ncbi:MAG: xylulose kinase, partial [Candidatus Thorarchaeota archaeon]|nr:xylulose kinase [Candidatus Thorarchaeota archaeon]
MTELVLAIDAGTTGVRSMFFDKSGNVVARAYSEFESVYPHPSWVEQRAESWWEKSCETIQHCIKEENINPEQIVAIGVTNQRETVVPIDKDGAPLRNAIVWQDRRTVKQCQWIEEKTPPAQVYSITGLTIDPYFTAPKILWIRENEKAIYDKADKFLLVHDFLIYRLSGEIVTDYSNASRTLLFDIRECKWSDSILNSLGISEEKLPVPVQSGTSVGELNDRAARETGLKQGTPVIAGGGDQQCAALG